MDDDRQNSGRRWRRPSRVLSFPGIKIFCIRRYEQYRSTNDQEQFQIVIQSRMISPHSSRLPASIEFFRRGYTRIRLSNRFSLRGTRRRLSFINSLTFKSKNSGCFVRNLKDHVNSLFFYRNKTPEKSGVFRIYLVKVRHPTTTPPLVAMLNRSLQNKIHPDQKNSLRRGLTFGYELPSIELNKPDVICKRADLTRYSGVEKEE